MFLACLKLSTTNEEKKSSITTMVRKDGVEHPSYGVLVQVDHMNDRKQYQRSL